MSGEFDSYINNLPAKFLFDFVMDLIGSKIYNQVIDDTKTWLYDILMDILDGSHALENNYFDDVPIGSLLVLSKENVWS